LNGQETTPDKRLECKKQVINFSDSYQIGCSNNQRQCDNQRVCVYELFDLTCANKKEHAVEPGMKNIELIVVVTDNRGVADTKVSRIESRDPAYRLLSFFAGTELC